MFDICELPSRVWVQKGTAVVDGSGNEILEATARVSNEGREAIAAFSALANNAFNVMMRRGWYPACDSEKWWVVSGGPAGIINEHCDRVPWADPFTALVEADKWYRENIEDKAK